MKRQYLLFVIVGVSFCVGLTMCLDVSVHMCSFFYLINQIVNYSTNFGFFAFRAESMSLPSLTIMARRESAYSGSVSVNAWQLAGSMVSVEHFKELRVSWPVLCRLLRFPFLTTKSTISPLTQSNILLLVTTNLFRRDIAPFFC